MKTLTFLAFFAAATTLAEEAAGPLKWMIRTGAAGKQVSPLMHGIFFEDINYAADGGLYAELVENRSFEHQLWTHAWNEEKRGDSAGSLKLETDQPIHPNNPRFLRLDVNAGGSGFGVSNLGYGGIPLAADAEYRFSIHARSMQGYSGGLLVRLEAPDGATLAEGRIELLTASWDRYPLTLTSNASLTNSRLVLLADKQGQIDIDMVSLFPAQTWKGRENGLRPDLVQVLADLKPGFMRFPGGCIVEGNDLANAYRWKDTVGEVWTRKQNWNRWKNEDPTKPDGQYHQTYGLGFYEYFQLCEDIGASPVPILNSGMSCQFQAGQLVPLNEIDPWVQDALDLIEFANGPASSTWGRLRADMGHPEPFGMTHLGIGNEQWGNEYFARYLMFHAALKKHHPEITLITTSGPGVDDANWSNAWAKFRSGTPADLVDEHYYRPPTWFLEQAGRYKAYDRNGPPIFAGEFAAHRTDRKSTLDVALSEAAFMTGLLDNADIVTMSCFAPLLAREGFTQWSPDLIWFDATHVMRTPSYHVQAMFGNHRPDRVLPSRLVGNIPSNGIQDRIGLGTWDTQVEFKDVVIQEAGNELLRTHAASSLNEWDDLSGTWGIRDGVISQKSGEMPAMLLKQGTVGPEFSISLKARKTGGNEGFLILFWSEDVERRTWWNIGGWGNSSHGVELQSHRTPQIDGKVETDQWYDIRIESDGGAASCFLDGQLIQQVSRPVIRDVYAVAGVDDAKKELVLQMTNPGTVAREIDIRLDGWPGVRPAWGQVLTSTTPNDLNTLSAADSVIPVEIKVPRSGDAIRHTLPPWSHTVLRVPGF